MIKVSVIIPVYNVEQYLRKCLDSVLNQSLKDIEIICIDDCSTDSSREILQEYASKDNRISLSYNEKNMGQAYARNIGINVACGKYIRFVDADDFICADSLEYTYNITEKYNLDFLKFRFERETNGVRKVFNEYDNTVNAMVINGVKLLDYFMEQKDYSFDISVCTCMMKREYLKANNITFYNGIYFEDFLFTYKVFIYAQKGMCINKVGYTYVAHVGSTTTKQKSDKHIYGLLVNINEIIKVMSCVKESRNASLAFIFYIHEKMMNYVKQLEGNVNQQYWEDDIKQLYNSIVFHHLSYQLDDNRINEGCNRIENESLVYIFGAGTLARQLLETFNERQVIVSGVLVSDAAKNVKALMGHRVSSIDSLQEDKDRVIIFVAVLDIYRQEVMTLLNEKGFKNIVYVGK